MKTLIHSTTQRFSKYVIAFTLLLVFSNPSQATGNYSVIPAKLALTGAASAAVTYSSKPTEQDRLLMQQALDQPEDEDDCDDTTE